MKVLASKKAMPKIGKAVDDRLNILLDEIMLSTTWSRPSILLALHKSKNHQEQTIFTMERRLAELSIEVVHITPGKDQLDILNIIRQKLTPNRNVFFVRGLGHQDEIYNGLNLHREMIVENQIKLIFWLTNEECISLSHKAPDFGLSVIGWSSFPPGETHQGICCHPVYFYGMNNIVLRDLKPSDRKLSRKKMQ